MQKAQCILACGCLSANLIASSFVASGLLILRLRVLLSLSFRRAFSNIATGFKQAAMVVAVVADGVVQIPPELAHSAYARGTGGRKVLRWGQ